MLLWKQLLMTEDMMLWLAVMMWLLTLQPLKVSEIYMSRSPISVQKGQPYPVSSGCESSGCEYPVSSGHGDPVPKQQAAIQVGLKSNS